MPFFCQSPREAGLKPDSQWLWCFQRSPQRTSLWRLLHCDAVCFGCCGRIAVGHHRLLHVFNWQAPRGKSEKKKKKRKIALERVSSPFLSRARTELDRSLCNYTSVTSPHLVVTHRTTAHPCKHLRGSLSIFFFSFKREL